MLDTVETAVMTDVTFWPVLAFVGPWMHPRTP